jgi:hypothetical protein
MVAFTIGSGGRSQAADYFRAIVLKLGDFVTLNPYSFVRSSTQQ